MKTFMGIDQSFTKTGYCVIDEKDVILRHGIIPNMKDNDIYERAWIISQSISTLVKSFDPTHIGLEGLAFSNFGNATRDLAGLQFVIIQQLRFIDKRFVDVLSLIHI